MEVWQPHHRAGTITMQSVCSPIARCWDSICMCNITSKAYHAWFTRGRSFSTPILQPHSDATPCLRMTGGYDEAAVAILRPCKRPLSEELYALGAFTCRLQLRTDHVLASCTVHLCIGRYHTVLPVGRTRDRYIPTDFLRYQETQDQHHRHHPHRPAVPSTCFGDVGSHVRRMHGVHVMGACACPKFIAFFA